MSAQYAELTRTITLSATAAQDRRDAVDAGGKREVAVQVMVSAAASAGSTLQMEHASVNEDIYYEAIGSSVSLASTGPKTILVTGHTRYLRWKGTITGGSATFGVNLVGRD